MNKILSMKDEDLFRYLEQKKFENYFVDKKIKTFSNSFEAIISLEVNSKTLENIPEIILLDDNESNEEGLDFLEDYIKIKPSLGKQITFFFVMPTLNDLHLKRIANMTNHSDFVIRPLCTRGLEEVRKVLELELAV